jgi:hypothetical protein
MTETSTNDVTPAAIDDNSATEDLDPEELDALDKQFYTILCSHLSSIEIHPKEETVLKIITYSRTQK